MHVICCFLGWMYFILVKVIGKMYNDNRRMVAAFVHFASEILNAGIGSLLCCIPLTSSGVYQQRC